MPIALPRGRRIGVSWRVAVILLDLLRARLTPVVYSAPDAMIFHLLRRLSGLGSALQVALQLAKRTLSLVEVARLESLAERGKVTLDGASKRSTQWPNWKKVDWPAATVRCSRTLTAHSDRSPDWRALASCLKSCWIFWNGFC